MPTSASRRIDYDGNHMAEESGPAAWGHPAGWSLPVLGSPWVFEAGIYCHLCHTAPGHRRKPVSPGCFAYAGVNSIRGALSTHLGRMCSALLGSLPHPSVRIL
jgi:hypothetical protein